ncbi:MAG: hypothetical protein ABI960_00690 [Candidatus Eisenbacteria bacterium]
MTPEDIGSHLHYDEQVALEAYVLRNYSQLLVSEERALMDGGLAQWWETNLERMHEWGARARKLLPEVPAWEPAPFDQSHAAQVSAIVQRLQAAHGGELRITRCAKCSRIGREPDDAQCPWCLAKVRPAS